MKKEEYNIIMSYLNDGKIEELKKYLIDCNYSSEQETLLKLINSDCDKIYPSYYQRVELKKGVMKVYNGFYTEMGNGFVILHRDSNIFQIYDRNILTPKMVEMLEGSLKYSQEGQRQKYTQIVYDAFSELNKDKLKPVYSKNEDGKCIVVKTKDGQELTFPAEYCIIAHKLLGEDTSEYIIKDGMYFDSPKGRAIVLRFDNQNSIKKTNSK